MNNNHPHSVARFYKVKAPNRLQVEMIQASLDDTLPSDHRARRVVEFVDGMNTNPCYQRFKSFLGGDGRQVTCPKVLFSLWLWALIDGVSSARKICELCERHDAYRWIAGGIKMNRTTLSEFRSADPNMFRDLLTSSLAVMIKHKLITQEDLAQDGTKVKASAGGNTFRTESTLRKLEAEAIAYLEEIEKEAAQNPQGYDNRKKAARLSAAKDRKDRVQKALEELEKSRQTKAGSRKAKQNGQTSKEALDKVRSSYSDPEARRMKMGDGGYRLAYNVQFVSGVDSKCIFGVGVGNTLDVGTLAPQMAQVLSRLKSLFVDLPKRWLADAGYSSKTDIQAATDLFPDCPVYSPAKVHHKCDPTVHRRGESEAISAWRDRLGSEEMKECYSKRSETAELVNAQTKRQGMTQFLVKGKEKVLGMATLHAIAHNVTRFISLGSKVL